MATARVQPESEAYLLELVRSGDHEAFYELVRPHERGIYLAALSIVNNDADAEEVVQEAILKAFKAIARFRAEAKYRQVLVLRDIEHLNIAETAKLVGISGAAVKTRLLRARLMMRDALAPGFDGAWKKGREYEKVRPW